MRRPFWNWPNPTYQTHTAFDNNLCINATIIIDEPTSTCTSTRTGTSTPDELSSDSSIPDVTTTYIIESQQALKIVYPIHTHICLKKTSLYIHNIIIGPSIISNQSTSSTADPVQCDIRNSKTRTLISDNFPGVTNIMFWKPNWMVILLPIHAHIHPSLVSIVNPTFLVESAPLASL